MLKISKPQQLFILLQFLYWLFVFVSFYIIQFGGFDFADTASFLKYMPLAFANYYICSLYLLPHFFEKKHYLKFFIYLILMILVFSLVGGFIHYDYSQKNIHNNKYSKATYAPVLLSFFHQVATAVVASFSVMIVKNYESLLKRNAIKSEIVNTQLSSLMHQIQPHFLFNTLNNLYALTLEKADKIPVALLHLSNLLRYIVYGTEDNKIALNKELEAIEWYIAIFQLRFDESLNIKKNIDSDVSIIIPQNSLLTLFENAIKHSQIGQYENGYISLDSKVINNELIFTITNTIDEEQETIESNSGVGLSNLKKRLEIIYPNQEVLFTSNQLNLFIATLKLHNA